MNIFGRKPKSKQPQKQRVLIFDAKEGIEEEKCEPVGRPWGLKGRYACLARRGENDNNKDKDKDNDNDKMVPYDPLQDWRKSGRMKTAKSPEALYDAIHWREVDGVYRLPPNLIEKLNTWLITGIFGILCFFTFLIYSSNTGG